MSAPVVMERARIAEMPAVWDTVAGDSLLERRALECLETVNPCGQRYACAIGAPATPPALAVIYRHRLNLLTFGPRGPRLRWPVRIVGPPLSVATAGLAGADGVTRSALLAHLRAQPGLTLALNTEAGRLDDDFIAGPTLPTYRLAIAWDSFADYLAALRSPYRRRVRRALARGAALTVESPADPAAFDAAWHNLYLNVYRRSRYPLECLTADYFRRYPAELAMFRTADGRPAGFAQFRRAGDRLWFLFGGLDDALRDACDTYWNLLLHLVRVGIERGCREVDFGQTAGTAKQRLGCRRVPLFMHATHRGALARRILRRLAPVLSHTPVAEEVLHVFR